MNLPKDFIEYTRRLMGEELYAAFEKGMQEEAPVSIRLNPFKLNTAQVCVKDRETDVPWCRNAMYLTSRPNFTFDPHATCRTLLCAGSGIYVCRPCAARSGQEAGPYA